MTELLLTKDHVSKVAKLLDELADWNEIIKNPLLGAMAEAGDGPTYRFTLTQLNVFVSSKIPDEYEVHLPALHAALDDVLDGDDDYGDAIDNAVELIDDILDDLALTPWLEAMVNGVLELVKAVLHYLDEKGE